LFPLFATSGKFVPGVVDTGRKLPPVSTTLAKPVTKFAAGVINTSGGVSLTPVTNLPPVSLIPVVHLDLRISREFSKKFETVVMGLGGN
jgi:hypothetical protein